MKKLIYISILMFCCIIQTKSFCQNPCLPEGITFTTQAEIDSFQVNYPGCTEIEGDVLIGANYSPTDITSLEGLNVITSIGKDLVIGVGYYWGNPVLTNLTGLEGVICIGGDLEIARNNALISLSGLEGLSSVGGDLTIELNDALNSLETLEGLTSVSGVLVVQSNDYLNSLVGLDNIDAGSIGNLFIRGNPQLSNCHVQSICDYLADPNGTVDIYNNAEGCNDPGEIALSCGYSMPCLPFGNYYFLSQSAIDNFQTNFPGCTELEGNVIISGDNISSLEGLNVITSIGSTFKIHNNPVLTSLTGLDGLTTIGENFEIYSNHAITSLTGLNSLTSIEGDLKIGTNNWNGNSTLTSLSGLETLTSIGEELLIRGNDSITSLAGLENIDAGPLESLEIRSNPQLSYCHVQSICEHLISPYSPAEIANNAPGCNSVEEVEEACESVGINEIDVFSLIIHPNPTDNGKVTINVNNLKSELLISCFNDLGQHMHLQKITDNRTTFSVTTWPPGIYLAVVYEDGKVVGRAKFIIQ